MTADTDKQTRAVFHEIHSERSRDEGSKRRIRTLISTEGLKVSGDFFNGKVCADLGCGSVASGTYNLLELGASFVHAMDLDEGFKRLAGSVLSERADFEGRWSLDVGSLARLPYDDATFDFILCQGVIHHVADDAKALGEIARTLKSGGMANLVVHGKGGLITRIGMELMRDEYANNPEFGRLVDEDLTPEWLADNIDWLIANIDDDRSENYEKAVTLLECLRDLLDKDFILTLRDRMQAPKYKMYSESEFTVMLREAGFTSWYRVNRKPAYKNIRKILAPMYHQYDAPLARLFYGDGMLALVAVK